jgi:16S rRNA G966 N2-methylase RsmD
MMSQTQGELRYGFGENWADYFKTSFSDEAVERSRAHLANFLRLDSLKGLTFLDIGCGSGLHSLAAHRLGADRIVSFDYDPNSVSTTEQVWSFAGKPQNWTVMRGSVLDRAFMEALPKADIVYSWGVLHHTGDMWAAVRNAAIPLNPDSLYYIALYSSDNYVDPPASYWMFIKRKYNISGKISRRVMEWKYAMRFHILPALKAKQNPLEVIRKYGRSRGMSFWIDARDWLGGYPMEFAGFRETQNFGKNELGLDLANVKTGEGCTEYLFCEFAQNARWGAINDERTIIPLHESSHQGGACYSVPLPHLQDQADCSETPRRSQLMVYEDGKMLGLAHSLHDHIVHYGSGRFSHWRGGLLFSATDNSNPNTNGRRYGYCETF